MTRHTCSGGACRMAIAVPPWAILLAPGGSASVTTTSPAARRRRMPSGVSAPVAVHAAARSQPPSTTLAVVALPRMVADRDTARMLDQRATCLYPTKVVWRREWSRVQVVLTDSLFGAAAGASGSVSTQA